VSVLLTAFSTLQSSKPVQLTEEETEYAVNVVKHTYPAHIVFQFNATNTIQEQQLENVSAQARARGCKLSCYVTGEALLN
jgi:hypothetical protein